MPKETSHGLDIGAAPHDRENTINVVDESANDEIEYEDSFSVRVLLLLTSVFLSIFLVSLDGTIITTVGYLP